MRAAGTRAIKTARAYRRWQYQKGIIARIARRLIRYQHQLWSMLSGSDIVLGAQLGDELMLPHPNGVVIHQDAVVGNNCMIMQQVTLGMIAGEPPIVGDNVYIGAGAKVLGAVKIGNGARIGANAVVLADVPAGATAVGIPACVVPKS